ncbi:hypothetical protein BD410DRAFT_757393 [Rickenella mellea]|uniref:Dipeptidase n=1 Tax=Rickenella mellea TaxID=50990 RepID=A0A4Y7PI44_9AGAM|nr:hypothetical protein BD410DRAFT_757393 [Rickenella mellea]
MPAHVDIPRLKEGRVGAFFWSVYVECKEDGPDFLEPTNRVRDTLEQIDVARLMIDQYPETFKLATSTEDITIAIREGKIASLLGVEGAHQLGNSLSVLRAYHTLGIRYLTLTHTCHNAFADSCGLLTPSAPYHGGLSPLGRTLITELNRLGILVDLSHTSDATARQALRLSRAPVIWSHSSARGVWGVARNVPDDILMELGVDGKEGGKRDGVVMVNFAPFFVAREGNASVQAVADHVEHIAKVAGKAHVGIGSDFDGINDTPKGLEDVSKYPALIAELIKRNWTRQDLAGLAGANLLRVLRGAEETARRMHIEGVRPSVELYGKRGDLPVRRGVDGAEL